MDLSFCFQDLHDDDDNFVKSFITEPLHDSYRQSSALLEEFDTAPTMNLGLGLGSISLGFSRNISASNNTGSRGNNNNANNAVNNTNNTPNSSPTNSSSSATSSPCSSVSPIPYESSSCLDPSEMSLFGYHSAYSPMTDALSYFDSEMPDSNLANSHHYHHHHHQMLDYFQHSAPHHNNRAPHRPNSHSFSHKELQAVKQQRTATLDSLKRKRRVTPPQEPSLHANGGSSSLDPYKQIKLEPLGFEHLSISAGGPPNAPSYEKSVVHTQIKPSVTFNSSSMLSKPIKQEYSGNSQLNKYFPPFAFLLGIKILLFFRRILPWVSPMQGYIDFWSPCGAGCGKAAPSGSTHSYSFREQASILCR